MTGGIQIVRGLLIYGICIPLAVYVGYVLASPLDLANFAMTCVVVMVLLLPILLRWHHPLLILTWNSSTAFFILPGISVWLVVAMISLTIAFVQRALSREMRFMHVPSIVWPLLFLAGVVFLTAGLTGGFGFRAFGSETVGAKRYLMLLAGIAGYFALTSQRIPPERANFYVGVFILGGLAIIFGTLCYAVAPRLSWPLYFFPIDDPSGVMTGPSPLYTRATNVGFAGGALVAYMLARYGIKGIFASSRPWRILLFVAFVAVSLSGGFRSLAVLVLLMFAAQFWLEGLMRTRLLPLFALTAVLGGALLIPLASHLPYTMQRALAFLPIEVDPVVRMDVQGSSDWRLGMWRVLLPEVPQYLLLGRGLGIRASDLAMAPADMKVGFEQNWYGSMLAGDYHNGPLSVVIPFGIWGAIGFLWFLAAALRLLHHNYRYGDERLRTANTFLLAYFIAQTVLFFTVFGGFYSGLMVFTGMAGLSVSLNGGVANPARKPAVAAPQSAPFASILPRPLGAR